MKHIKLFEGYLDDKLKNYLEELKSEVDQYMYSILDDLQTDSSKDSIVHHYNIIIDYHGISLELIEEKYKEKLIRLSKVLKKEFDMGIEISECSKFGNYIDYENLDSFIERTNFKYKPVKYFSIRCITFPTN